MQRLQDGHRGASQPSTAAQESREKALVSSAPDRTAVDPDRSECTERQGARRRSQGTRSGIPDESISRRRRKLRAAASNSRRNSNISRSRSSTSSTRSTSRSCSVAARTCSLSSGSTLATRDRVDVTNDVLAALNAALPTISDHRSGSARSHSRRAANGDERPAGQRRHRSAWTSSGSWRRCRIAIRCCWSTGSKASIPDKGIVAIKAVTINEPFFQGHFPARPIMPGVLHRRGAGAGCGRSRRRSARPRGLGQARLFHGDRRREVPAARRARRSAEARSRVRSEALDASANSPAGRRSTAKLAAEANFTAMIADPPAA